MTITASHAWAALTAHHQKLEKQHLRDLFADDPDRAASLSLSFEDILFDFSKQRALFSHKETGDDVIHVLDRYLDLCAKIRAEAEAEAPLLRAALRWFPKALSEKQEMKSHGMG